MTRLELHYASGGHGGPYYDIDAAIQRACELLNGSQTEHRIDVREGIGGRLLAAVVKVRSGSQAGAIIVERDYSK